MYKMHSSVKRQCKSILNNCIRTYRSRTYLRQPHPDIKTAYIVGVMAGIDLLIDTKKDYVEMSNYIEDMLKRIL